MRKRKEKPEICKTMAAVVQDEEKEDDDEEEERGNGVNGFFSCYLLASACPRFNGHTYIGFESFPLHFSLFASLDRTFYLLSKFPIFGFRVRFFCIN